MIHRDTSGFPIVILGAGITGLTAASELARRDPGLPCVIYEKEAQPGGLCRTSRQCGFTFDTVSHVLHFRSAENQRLVEGLLRGRLLRLERKSRIYFRERYVPYPFQTHIGFLGWTDRLACSAGLMAAALGKRDGTPANFEQWVREAFGDGIAGRFMTPYNQKLWGSPLDELSTDWIQTFVPRVSAMQVAKSFFKKPSVQGYNSTFAYPGSGIQELPDRLKAGQDVRCEREAREIDLDSRTVRFSDGESTRFGQLLSTIPLDVLVSRSVGVPERLRAAAKKLRATSLLSITFGLKRRLPHDYHWVYFAGRDFPYFRLFFASNLVPSFAPAGSSLVAAEISNPEGAGVQDEVVRGLQRLGYIAGEADIAFASATALSHAYPVHTLDRAETVAALLEFFGSRKVCLGGRFGEWKYSSIDDCMTSGRTLAGQLTQALRV